MSVNTTKLQQTTKALEESRQVQQNQLAELKHLYRTAAVGLCLMDTDLRFVRINDQLAAINGKPVAEHIGKTLREIVPEIAEQVEPIYRRVIETGEPALNFEVRGTTPAKPSEERVWMVSYYPVKSKFGAVFGVSTVVQDITERKQAEEEVRILNQELEKRVNDRTEQLEATNRKLEDDITARKQMEAEVRHNKILLQTIMDESNLAIFVKKEEDLSHVWMSKRFEEVVGISRSEAQGKTNRELFGEEIGAAFDATDREVLTGKRIEKEESPDGEHVYWSQKFPIKLPDGNI